MTAGLSESRIAARSQGRPGICYYHEKGNGGTPELSFPDMGKCISLMKKGETEACVQTACAALDAVKAPEDNLAALRLCAMSAASLIADGILPEPGVFIEHRPDWKSLTQCASREEIKEWLSKSIRRLSGDPEGQRKKSTEYIERALAYMERRFMEDISLEQTAQAAGISSFYLSRLLKQRLRQSFVETLTEIRMRHALKMMWDKRYSVKEIAGLCGYGSLTYFYKVFKKYTGMSVGEVRETME